MDQELDKALHPDKYPSKHRNKLSDWKYSKLAARVLSVLLAAIFLAYTFGLYPNIIRHQTPTKSSVAMFMEAATLFTFAALVGLQGDKHSLGLGKKRPLDERQMALRRKVYEKSYVALYAFVVILLLAAQYKNIPLQVIRDGGDSVYFSYLITMFFVAGIPSSIAAWTKDA